MQRSDGENKQTRRSVLRAAIGSAAAAALQSLASVRVAIAQQTSGQIATASPGLNYLKVRALVVGVLRWRSAALATFPQEGRKDQALVDVLRAKGVTADRIVFLRDQQATKRAIERALQRMVALTQADEVLLVYYAGHGGRLESSEAFFLPYDVNPLDLQRTGWSMRSVIGSVTQRPFEGTAMVAADCCYSGTLVREAESLATGRPVAVLASSLASVVSTSTWSFTECLVSAFEGRAVTDVDHNGLVTVRDLARFTVDQMAFAEEQLASWTVRNGFSPDLVLNSAPRSTQTRVGERVEVLWNGTWYRAQVEAERSNALQIHYIGYARSWDEWAPLDRVRTFVPRVYAVGEAVEVEWHGQWYCRAYSRSPRGDPSHSLRQLCGKLGRVGELGAATLPATR